MKNDSLVVYYLTSIDTIRKELVELLRDRLQKMEKQGRKEGILNDVYPPLDSEAVKKIENGDPSVFSKHNGVLLRLALPLGCISEAWLESRIDWDRMKNDSELMKIWDEAIENNPILISIPDEGVVKVKNVRFYIITKAVAEIDNL